MPNTIKVLRMLQGAMLLSIVLYAFIGEAVGPKAQAVNPTLSYLFSTLSVAVVGIIFVVRRTMVFPASESLVAHPDDSVSLNHWKTGYIITYALCEALALLGLVLRFLGSTFPQSVLFYIGGFVLLFFFRPRQPHAAAI